MGLLVEGKWQNQWYDTKTTKGEFVRKESQFRNWITSNGTRESSEKSDFVATADRYHLFVSLACPWAHRTLIFRRLKDLQKLIGITIVEPLMLENGWEIGKAEQQNSPVNGINYLYQLYLRTAPHYTGRVTVPVLWDKERKTIVNNESADIIRMFNSAFDDLTGNRRDFYPIELRAEIDEINERIYHGINNGVYKAGFATSQEAYVAAFDRLFRDLDWLEERLADQRYLVGELLTEADIRLFTTLIRFDAVYVGHFKTNLRRIEDYPNLSNYLCDIYQYEDIAATVDFNQIKSHYYGSHMTINPTGIIPKGPKLNFMRPHDRDRFS